ncbi:MAG: DMT family transporter [Rhodospirillales bacterium]|nr:DMT family transporter [Rhodospirillales bacterium]
MSNPSSHPSESVPSLPLDSQAGPTADKVIAGVVYGALAALVWGISPVMIRLGVTGALDPYDLVALRFVVCGVILLPLVVRRGMAGLGWGVVLAMVAGAGAPFILLMAGGLMFAPAGHAGIIIPSIMLSCSMIGGWVVLGERPNAKRFIGYGVILAGIGLVGLEGLAGGSGPDAWIGDLMFVCAGMAWAVYTVASKVAKAEPLHATALVAVISMSVYLPPYLIWGGFDILAAPLSEILLQGFFQGIVLAILALFFYTRAVAYLGAARGAVFAALVPGLAVVSAFPALGEIPSGLELAGVFVVSGGMLYALGLTRPARNAVDRL